MYPMLLICLTAELVAWYQEWGCWMLEAITNGLLLLGFPVLKEVLNKTKSFSPFEKF